MKIQSPWMGRVRGSAGNMTGCKVYDKNVLRAKAFEVANPKTAAQVMQRNFMKQVIDITKTVSEEQLRSLFGIKPSKMSRRNALSQQIAAAFTIEDGVKSVDFSKLGAIGNGKTVSTPLMHIVGGAISESSPLTIGMYGENAKEDSNPILVMFDSDNNRIVVANIDAWLVDYPNTNNFVPGNYNVLNGYCYATCATDGSNVCLLPFGQFTIKTRRTKAMINITPDQPDEPGGGGDEPQPEAPNAPVISGTSPFDDSTQATITAQSGAVIYYTTNGSTPTTASSVYSSAITLNATTTVKAIAVANGLSSTVASKTFTKNESGGGGGGGDTTEDDGTNQMTKQELDQLTVLANNKLETENLNANGAFIMTIANESVMNYTPGPLFTLSGDTRAVLCNADTYHHNENNHTWDGRWLLQVADTQPCYVQLYDGGTYVTTIRVNVAFESE